MLDNYTLDGDDYSQEDVLSAAEAKGLTIEEYISEYYPDDSSGKQTDSPIETPSVESSTVSTGEDDSTVTPIIEGTIDPATGKKWTREAAIAKMKAKGESGKGMGGTVVQPTVQNKIQNDILDIKNSIDKDNNVVKKRLAKDYFNLDNFKRE